MIVAVILKDIITIKYNGYFYYSYAQLYSETHIDKLFTLPLYWDLC